LEVSWLLPAALILLVAGLWVTLRAPRTDRLRAAMLLWGGWTLVTGLVLSFMSGTMHPYYTVALAPGIAALVGTGTVALWQRRSSIAWRGTLALAVAATVAWDFMLLAGSGESFAWVRWVVLAAGVVAVVGLVAGSVRRAAVIGIAAAALVGLAGTSAYAVTTAAAAHSGSIPSVGTSASAMGGPRGGGVGQGGPGGTPPGMISGTTGSTSTTGSTADTATATDATGGPMGGAGMGGATSAELTALLSKTASTWSAAVSSSQSAASLELASGTAVMSTGGWSGSDSAVTLAQFQADVANGEIHYYIGGGQGGGPGGGDSGSTSSQISAWVEKTFTSATVGGQTVYDLTSPIAA
jgi:4-amino-4-deoxy-L-arabinose transferase-like glycosyltransferase